LKGDRKGPLILVATDMKNIKTDWLAIGNYVEAHKNLNLISTSKYNCNQN